MIKNGLPAIHPGEFLGEILDDLKLSQAQFARGLGISPMRISLIRKGLRPITAEIALRIGRALNQTPQYWLSLQTTYELKTVERALGARLSEVKPLAA